MSADLQKFKQFTSSNYSEQGKCFLNAYWNEYQSEADKVWTWANKFAELDQEKKGEGTDLDEFNAHRFLESLNETKTVRQMREEIKHSDLDFNKRLALIEYCLWKYKRNVKEFVNRPQGGDAETARKLAQAEQMLREVREAFVQSQKREAEAKKAESDAHKSEADAKQKQAELEQAVRDLQREEQAYNQKTEELKQKSETGGQVSRNKAKAELEIHLKEDPLPLRRAKITAEAAERKAKKATEEAIVAREAAVQARKQAEAAVQEAATKVQEAEDYLEELKKTPGSKFGHLWWLDKELSEQKKYLPQRKQK